MSTVEDGVLPRLLAGIPVHGSMGLAAHRARHGDLPIGRRRDRRWAAGLVAEVERSGLRGRGGAAFPLGRKLRAVSEARARPIVVVNGCEGEPASVKDRLLVERLPHLVADGALLAATALGASDIVFALDDEAAAAAHSLRAALAERADMDGFAVRMTAVPRGYVSGQESAVVNFLSGGSAKPRATPPMVFQRGVQGRPTLVSNVETLGHLALIARHGADWFRTLGTDAEPGSTLVTLSGAVAYPGVYEIELGVPLEMLLDAAGGTTRPLRAFVLGGYAGSWVSAAIARELALGEAELDDAGATLGAGIVIAVPDDACPVAETANVATWLANQSAGQCGPCANGLPAIAGALRDVARGRGGSLPRIERWAAMVRGRGACAHPDGAARFVSTALDAFGAEFEAHAIRGPCRACPRHFLPVPAARPATLERRMVG